MILATRVVVMGDDGLVISRSPGRCVASNEQRCGLLRMWRDCAVACLVRGRRDGLGGTPNMRRFVMRAAIIPVMSVAALLILAYPGIVGTRGTERPDCHV